MEQSPYPYPEAEHLPELVSMADRLHEELRTSGEGAMLRDNIILGLGSVYGSTQLARSFYAYSELMAKVGVDGHGGEAMQVAKLQMIYAGSLMAMHVGVSSPFVGARQQVLAEKLGGVDEVLAGNGVAMALISRHLSEVRDSMPEMVMREQTTEDQLAVARLVYASLSDIDDESALMYGEDVRFGYVYGTHVINKLKRRHSEPLTDMN